MKTVTCLSFLFFAGLCGCQDSGQAQQDPKQLLAETMKLFEQEKIRVDLKAGTATIECTVNEPQDPIEYLLIHRKGKRHEALFWTMSKPSVLNAALLMIGLEQGKNASVVDKDPPPTPEEIEKGAEMSVVTPAEGKPYWMTVKWKTAEGRFAEYCIEDLLLDLSTQKPVADCTWVYLAGRMAKLYKNEPEVFVADFEGNLVSVCYLMPSNHLGTMAHKDARDDQNWWLTDKVPEPGTVVELTFHSKKPQIEIDRDKRIADEKAAAQKAAGETGKETGGKDKETGGKK